MKRALALVFSLLIFSISANAQNVLTGKEIYGINREAVVQIGIGDNFSGDGFIISSDGLIITANHVVTTRESRFKEYASDLRVRVVHNGIATIYPATQIESKISDDQINFDSVRLKIKATNLPHVTLGDWNEIEIGSQITLITSFPGTETIMLQGPVSGKAAAATDLGPKPVNTIWFQCPVRNGFSGSPIFSARGHVIGIVDTKVFGISPSLDVLRKEWMDTRTQGTISMFGINVSDSFLELINNLDQNLISGLGNGVAIEYAKKQQEAPK